VWLKNNREKIQAYGRSCIGRGSQVYQYNEEEQSNDTSTST
jgi:hypothetical protein